jgi:hypothetical protein
MAEILSVRFAAPKEMEQKLTLCAARARASRSAWEGCAGDPPVNGEYFESSQQPQQLPMEVYESKGALEKRDDRGGDYALRSVVGVVLMSLTVGL